MDMRLRMGSAMAVTGPSSSGKTVFILNLIDHAREMFDITPQQVFWCYGHKTALHDQMTSKNFNMIQGIPKNFDFITPNSIVMLDDLMVESGKEKSVSELFIRSAHHVPCFVIFTQQNAFPPDKEGRNRSRNTQYLVIFKNPMDESQIQYLERRMFPNSKGFLTYAFAQATQRPHSYLFLDSHQKTPAIARVRARVLPFERPMTVFVDKRYYGDVTTSKYLKYDSDDLRNRNISFAYGK